MSRLACAGCGAPVPDGPAPFRCPTATPGDDIDHVVARRLDLARVRFPRGGHTQPFVRYREFLHSYHAARAGGLDDRDFVAHVERLDRAIAAVDGHGFVETPFAPEPALGVALGLEPAGAVWVKDETGNVAGSHKARHLMGVALWLEVAEALAARRGAPLPRAPLAIASCGNAALAAAVVARAAARALEVFIPPDAERAVVERLQTLGATIAVCARDAGAGAAHGDPCVHAFRRAVLAGHVPFTCQGSENGLAIEGGQTLGYEMASGLAGQRRPLDRLFVQVGGGALASATIQALREAAALGVIPRMPRIHAVQTLAAHPLARAWEHLAAWQAAHPGRDAARAALDHATRHRSEFMSPWETAPHSAARGILDDETYDWRAIVAGMIETGGSPVLVSEERLAEANALARSTTRIPVCVTGSAGLAGLIELERRGEVAPGESVAVLFTGVAR
ncbi:MAG TPA: pyridoxal-phosphate dependent enzyme [Candidatus Eisenbacteria bacterium]